jgi:DNA replication factor GINS
MLNSTDLSKVHNTGFKLEDVKVTFLHDIKINVAGVDVEGKQGEILNIPRWVANVLEYEKHVNIEDTDMVVELKQATVKENVQGEFELATLEPHFYVRLLSYMKKLPKDDYDKVESMLNSLVRKRQGKIIHLADSSKLTADLSQKLTLEERSFYEKIYNTSIDFKKQILGDKK